MRRPWPWAIGVLVIGAAIAAWWWLGNSRKQEAQGARRAPAVTVVTTKAESRDVPVKVRGNGTVTALQTTDLRAQITSTVREIHIREGQNVAKDELLISLDSRAEEANLKKAIAQVEKDQADLATAKRNLDRQRDLFQQKFISQAALDVAQNQVDTLTGQLAVDTASIESAKVARAYTEIRAPFAGRTGLVSVRAGSLVQPTAATATTAAPPLVTVTQVDPISVTFTVPEKELPGLQKAIAAGPVTVTARTQDSGEEFKGRVSFVDNAVDSTSGTLRLKAEFPNPSARLWPGMYVAVEISPRTLANATVIPAQAVQTGPDGRFVYEVTADNKVASRPITLAYVDQGIAAVEGVAAGARVVVEGAQNVRPGTAVAEADRGAGNATKTGKEEGKKGKRDS